MKLKITTRIKELEVENGIKVLLASEIGPAALDLPLKSFDHKIGFVYIKPKDWYISIEKRADQINFRTEDEAIEFRGLDLRKALNLLSRSNTSILEQIQAKTSYAVPDFKAEIQALSVDFYAPVSVMYHHVSFAKKLVDELNQTSELSYLKSCYLMRSALTCKWVTKESQIPPLSLTELLNDLKIEPTIKAEITQFIRAAKSFTKPDLLPTRHTLFDFLNTTLHESEAQINKLSGAQNKSHDINAVFVKWLNREDLFFRREVG